MFVQTVLIDGLERKKDPVDGTASVVRFTNNGRMTSPCELPV